LRLLRRSREGRRSTPVPPSERSCTCRPLPGPRKRRRRAAAAARP
jgi:hypothetical protein